ncbi:MAG: hypothetical protein ACLR5S_12295 [Ruminococcus sp.]
METQVVLPLLDTDLVDIGAGTVPWISWTSAGKWLCGLRGYGERRLSEEVCTGLPIAGLDENGQTANCFVYHAGTKLDETFLTAGGRVLRHCNADTAGALETFAGRENHFVPGPTSKEDVAGPCIEHCLNTLSIVMENQHPRRCRIVVYLYCGRKQQSSQHLQVYLMNQKSEIIYVGKAKNLKIV